MQRSSTRTSRTSAVSLLADNDENDEADGEDAAVTDLPMPVTAAVRVDEDRRCHVL